MTDQQTSGQGEPDDGGKCARSGGRRFKTSHIVLAVLAVLAGTWLVGAALHAGERSGSFIHAVHGGGWHHGRGPGGMLGRLCGERRGEWLDARIDAVESFVTFTPEQAPAWDSLVTAVRSGGERVGEACTALDGEAQDPTGRLARMEIMLAAGLDVVREVRPAFNDFYAVLDDDQKAALDRLMERRRGRD